MEQKAIRIFDVVGGRAAVSTEDGDRLFGTLCAFLEEGFFVVLDFTDVQTLTSTFLNAAIGQLYSRYDSPFLQGHVKISHLAREDRALMEKVIERAKEYFRDKEGLEKDVREALGDE